MRHSALKRLSPAENSVFLLTAKMAADPIFKKIFSLKNPAPRTTGSI